jgi:hypothetical protein
MKCAKCGGQKMKAGGATKGMGFKAAQKGIAKKSGVSMEAAGAILASSSRKASPAAKRKKVKGKAK